MRAHNLIAKLLLEVNMRPINVTLCSTTWELAKQKANFSGWVRRKLSEEARIVEKKAETRRVMFEAHCERCDLWYDSAIEEKMIYFMCHKCDNKCKFMGASE